MDLLARLEDRLRYQWELVAKAKTQQEAIKLREEAMKTYRLLKQHKLMWGIK